MALNKSQPPWVAILKVTNANQPTHKYNLIPQKSQQEQYENPRLNHDLVLGLGQWRLQEFFLGW